MAQSRNKATVEKEPQFRTVKVEAVRTGFMYLRRYRGPDENPENPEGQGDQFAYKARIGSNNKPILPSWMKLIADPKGPKAEPVPEEELKTDEEKDQAALAAEGGDLDLSDLNK